jgi:two-component system OmpR family response regulator
MIGPPTPDATPRDRLLVVEDDADIRGMVRAMLEERGYDVLTAHDGRDMERLLHRERLDLVVLDVMLPGEDGVSLCRRLRTRYGVPILMLTALGSETDRIVGLESGADDYLVKPFAPRELVARVRALLRRTGRHTRPAAETPYAYEFGGWELNLIRLSLTAPGGALVPLTNAEFTLLAALCARAGEVVSREALLTRGEGAPVAAYDRSVDTLIVRLRRKLAAHLGGAAEADMIRTVRNAGYQFVPEVTLHSKGGAV